MSRCKKCQSSRLVQFTVSYAASIEREKKNKRQLHILLYLLAMLETVARLLLGPSFNSRVTAPSASVQVISKGVPSVTSQLVLVKATRAKAWEMAAEKATRRAANCILADMMYELIIRAVLLREECE